MARKALMIAAGILFAGGVAVTSGCYCAFYTDLKVCLAQADAAFAGTVVKIEEIYPAMVGTNRMWSRWKVTLRVSQTWKGTNAPELAVRTDMADNNCGYYFLKGSNYVVFASSGGAVGTGSAEMFTSNCNGTRTWAEVASDLAQLGEGRTPPTNSNTKTTH